MIYKKKIKLTYYIKLLNLKKKLKSKNYKLIMKKKIKKIR